jgi:hypothetical protein
LVDTGIISGASAIGGALVGAATGGLVQWRLERHRSRRRAKAGARLLRADLAINEQRITDVISSLLWWPFYRMAMEPWANYGDVMAEVLDADAWGAVSQAVIELRELDEWIRKTPHWDGTQPLTVSRESAARIILMRADIILAFNALGALADDSEETALTDPPAIGRPRQPDRRTDGRSTPPWPGRYSTPQPP